ncbi:MAG: flagellar biosynthesis anti-sigma factor FlgM [Desulfobulbaceae bacterium]|nr:flagellar biosynthesis anti-sigma factor FlgM [Desulfobulbaceae bacterium]
MSIDFYGIKSFGQMGNIRKNTAPEELKGPTASSGKKGTIFSAALDNVANSAAAPQNETNDRVAKIDAIKQQVINGSYQPDMNNVAASLLKFIVERG